MDPHNDERLTAYIDGRLSPEEVERLEDELAANPRMAELLGEMRVVRELMQRISQEAAPKTLYERVMETVDSDAAQRRGSFFPSGMGMPVVSLMLAATFLLVMNQFVGTLKQSAGDPAAPPPAMTDRAAAAPSEVPAAPPPPGGAPPEVAPPPPVAGTPLPPDPRPYFMAPDAYRLTRISGTASGVVLQALQEAAKASGGSLVDKQGAPVTSPNANGEVWVALDASQVRAFRHALEGRVRIDMIGMARMIEGPQRLRVVVEDPP